MQDYFSCYKVICALTPQAHTQRHITLPEGGKQLQCVSPCILPLEAHVVSVRFQSGTKNA